MKMDGIEENQQAMPPDDPAHVNNINEKQQQSFGMSDNQVNAKVPEESEDPGYSTVNHSPRWIPQPSDKPACRKVLKAAARPKKKKPAPTVATWSVTCRNTVNRVIPIVH